MQLGRQFKLNIVFSLIFILQIAFKDTLLNS